MRRVVQVPSGAASAEERDHFVREVRHDDVGVAVLVEIPRIDSHATPRSAALAVRDPDNRTDLLERAVSSVAEEEVPHRVVRHDEIRPAVSVMIDRDDAECLSECGVDAGSVTHVFESVSRVPEEEIRGGRIRFGRAVDPVDPVRTALDVTLRAPLDIATEEEVETAVAIVVDERSTGRESGVGESPLRGHVFECAVAAIAVEVILPECGDDEVEPAVPVDVADRGAHSIEGVCEAARLGDVFETPPTEVSVERTGGPFVASCRFLSAGPRVRARCISARRGARDHPTADEVEIREAVPVVVEERSACPHRFRQEPFRRRGVHMDVVDPGPSRDVDERTVEASFLRRRLRHFVVASFASGQRRYEERHEDDGGDCLAHRGSRLRREATVRERGSRAVCEVSCRNPTSERIRVQEPSPSPQSCFLRKYERFRSSIPRSRAASRRTPPARSNAASRS